MAITIQQLRYLTAVAEHGSLTAAAAHLGVSQPVLSRALATLQRELKVPLFQRSERRLVLTPGGEAAIAPARRALTAIDDVKRAAIRKPPPPPLRIAAQSTLLSVVAATIRETIEQQPDMHLRVSLADAPEILAEMVRTDKVDFAFGERPPQSLGLTWLAWGSVEVVLVSPPGLALPDEVSVADLTGLRLISRLASSKREPTFDDMFLRAGVKPNIVLEVEDLTMILPLTQAGIGSFFGWRFICEAYPLVVIRPIRPSHGIEIGFACSEARRPEVRDFIDRAMVDAPHCR